MYDAIIVLGGSFKDNGELQPWVYNRLDESMKYETKYFLLLSRSTCHKPPVLDSNGYPIDECRLMAKYLIDNGVSKEKILLESWSLDTIGNAYAAFFLHCLPNYLTNNLIITSDFHMPRSETIFRKIFTLGEQQYGIIFSLNFISTKSELVISQKEKNSLIDWKNKCKSINTIQELHNFIFINHDAYCSEVRSKKYFNKEDMKMYLGN